MCSYFNFALLGRNYFQFFEYLTSLFYNMTPPKEVNSDKDDNIGIFTVQNSVATVSVQEQLNSYVQQPVGDVQLFCLFPQLKELFVTLNTPLRSSLPANDYSVLHSVRNFHAKTRHNFLCEIEH